MEVTACKGAEANRQSDGIREDSLRNCIFGVVILGLGVGGQADGAFGLGLARANERLGPVAFPAIAESEIDRGAHDVTARLSWRSPR